MENYMGECEFSPEENPTVLIVDDSRSIRRYVEELLVKEGYNVITAADGFAGLESINRDAPDLILLDVEMPGMSGIEVLDVLGMEQRLSSIILFTTRSSLENRVQGLNMGADDYITKPFVESELLARVRAGLRTAKLKKELAYARNRALDALNKLHDAQRRIIDEQKLVAVARLAAGVAHEVNNPLGFIQSNLHTLSVYARILAEGSDRMLKMAELLLDTDAGLQKEAVEILDWMKKVKLARIRQDLEPLITESSEGIERIAAIVNSLRVLDQAKTFMKTEQEDLGEVVSSFVFSCRLKLPPEVSFLTDCDGSRTNTFCNRGQLNIALDNILQNALDAVGENGEIRVRLFKNESWACVQVLDSGDGISSENLGKVFDPFFTTKTNPWNVGLGLTVAQCLAHAHGGRIEISSAPGQGSNVMVMLPLDLNDLSWSGK
jgi:signal transduction histidine kinase